MSSAEPPRQWTPRIWEGCNAFAWLHLLARNRFAVDWSHLPLAVAITGTTLVNTLLRGIQDALFDAAVRRVRLHDEPIFILGHWRAGTTLLHELLALDPRHTFPTTFECLGPNHFLLTGAFLPPLLTWMLPNRRPMDNMGVGWDRPQEDEFALCMLGQPSPYWKIAFPNRSLAPPAAEALDVDGLSPRARRLWKRTLLHFLQQVTYRRPGRLVLKSPTHTCRIPVLLEMFPRARFVHIVRNPYVLFASTMHLWRTLYNLHGLQTPTFQGLEEYVFTTFSHFFERVGAGKRLVEPGRFHELRYEDLVRDPLAEVEGLYEGLGLDGFAQVRPRLEEHLAANRGYQTNRHRPLTPELNAEISRRWGEVIRRYGYATEAASAAG